MPRGSINVAIQVVSNRLSSLGIDAGDVVIEVRKIGFVEAVALVRKSSMGYFDKSIHNHAGDYGAVRMVADLVVSNNFFSSDQNGRCGSGDIGIHVGIAVDL